MDNGEYSAKRQQRLDHYLDVLKKNRKRGGIFTSQVVEVMHLSGSSEVSGMNEDLLRMFGDHVVIGTNRNKTGVVVSREFRWMLVEDASEEQIQHYFKFRDRMARRKTENVVMIAEDKTAAAATGAHGRRSVLERQLLEVSMELENAQQMGTHREVVKLEKKRGQIQTELVKTVRALALSGS